MAYSEINVEDLKQLVEKGDLNIVDIRDPDSFAASHIEKALNLGDSNVDAFVETADHDKDLVICCYHGHSSVSAAAYMSEKGFKQVYSLKGGMEEWNCS
jgi:thiosulfate sulfurtransferase